MASMGEKEVATANQKGEVMTDIDVHSSVSNVVGTSEPAGASGWRRCLPGPLRGKASAGGDDASETSGKSKKARKPFNFRHHQMLNLTSGIGMGLFVTSGRQLAIGGPGSLLINNFILAITLYFVSCRLNSS